RIDRGFRRPRKQQIERLESSSEAKGVWSVQVNRADATIVDIDDMVLETFRDQLRDGAISVYYHGVRGEPVRGVLELQEDKETLVWRNTNRFRYMQPPSARINLHDVRSVREGRQTSNFVRTIKYVPVEELPRNDDHCLSLCVPNNPEHHDDRVGESDRMLLSPTTERASALYSFDIEFDDCKTRDVALSFFREEASLNETTDVCDSSDIVVPRGWPTLCFQVITHPSFELLVFVVVVICLLCIALESFIIDDSERNATLLDDVLLPEISSPSLSATEGILLALLTAEQIAKVVALEGIRPLARVKWDLFDFAIVWVSWLALIPNTSFSGITMVTLRLFRGVRLFKHWEGFHHVVETFLLSLPMAWNALLCYLYYLFLFAILGMYLFNDSMAHRCSAFAPSSIPPAPMLPSPSMAPISASMTPAPAVQKEWVAAFPARFCRIRDPTTCKKPLECVTMKAPNNGYTGFHTFQASFLTVFLITLRAGFGSSLDGAVHSTSYLSAIFFIGLVVFVSYMILSLYVGIVRGSYITVTMVRKSKLEERLARLENYRAKNRVMFPSATERVPDLLELFHEKWRIGRNRAYQAFLESSLFTGAGSENAIWNRFRLRQDRLFYIIEHNSPLVDKATQICESVFFEHLMNFVVFLNSIFFAMEYHGMSREYSARLYAAENSLIILYVGEFFVVCVTAGGLRNYLKSPWNRLDFFLLMAAFLEYVCLATSLFLYADNYGRAIFVLRLFRLVRPFRVIRKKNELLHVLDALLASVQSLVSLVTFHIMINSFFAVVGMRLFGGKFPLTMRSHFNTFGDSMLTLFKIACGGNVWQIFHTALQATSFSTALCYFMAYFILCVSIVLNYMLVVLLRNFAMKEDERKKTLSDQFQERMLVMQRIHHFDEYAFLQDFSELYQSDIMYATLSGSAEKRAKIQMSVTEEIKARLLRVLPTSDFLKIKGISTRGGGGGSVRNGITYARLEASLSPPSRRTALTPVTSPSVSTHGGNHSPTPDRQLATLTPESPLVQEHQDQSLRARIKRFFGGEWLTEDVSLFMFPLHSRFRLKCKKLEKDIDKYVFSAIVLRTILLTIESPLYSNLIQEFTTLTDVLFVLVLLFEFSIKVVSRGFLFTPKSYLSNPWNQINMVVLMSCSLLLLLPHSTMITLFRLGRAFGPIRVFYRVKTFRVITEALKQSAKQIFCCVVITLFLFYSFATLGMQFFAGKFSFCNDPTVRSRVECDGFFVNTKSGVLMPRTWDNLAGMHFDNIGGAMGSVFVLVSKKGWLPVLNMAMDIVDSDHQPVQNASAYFALFFVSFIFLSRFYMLKVFGGIIMNNFRCYNGTLLLTNLQLIWMRNKQAILQIRPKYPLPRNEFLQRAQIFVQTRFFRAVISCTVLLHTFLLAWYRSPVGREWTDDTDGTTPGVWGCHFLFSTIYAMDAIMCVVSMGWKDFLMKGFTWRTTNACTAFIMLVGPLFSNSPVLLVLGMSRAFDFKHISLVFDRFFAIRTLFETLLGSVRLILKVTLLLGYVLFIFAIMAMQLFPLTRWNYGLDANANFATFPAAYTTFVKFAAGEDWYDTYQACSVGPPKCTSAGSFMTISLRQASDCGSAFFSSIFYHTYYILVALILQNLYIATMVDTYVSTFAIGGENEEESLQLLGFKSDDLKHFQAVWSEFDTEALGVVHKKHLLALMTRLESPLGIGDHASSRAKYGGDLAYTKRRAMYEDIDARVNELNHRLRITQDDPGSLLTCPSTVLRFTELLVVLSTRIVPLESFTVQDKVDELAVRGYVKRHRMAITIQSTFRMYRVLRRKKRRQQRLKYRVVPVNMENGNQKVEEVSQAVASVVVEDAQPVSNVIESAAAEALPATRSRSGSTTLTSVAAAIQESILATSPLRITPPPLSTQGSRRWSRDDMSLAIRTPLPMIEIAEHNADDDDDDEDEDEDANDRYASGVSDVAPRCRRSSRASVTAQRNNRSHTHRMRSSLVVFAVSSLVLGLAKSSGSRWGYREHDPSITGPSQWTNVNASCGGRHQSPVDLPTSGPDVINLWNKTTTAPLRFFGDCDKFALHTLDDAIHWDFTGDSKCKVSVYLDDAVSYSLAQFHIHTLSEHTIDGHRYAGEIHFVHQEIGGDGVLVTALLVDIQQEINDNAWVESVWRALPQSDQVQPEMVDLHLNYVDLLNHQTSSNHIFNYHGSLTTPPCSEIVSWWVIATPIGISEAEFKQLALAYSRRPVADTSGHDDRPIQPLNDRKVLYY
ncbi:TPA: hypothetical protein N0F65_007566, partial [Lagenidium giganteum]